MESLAMSSSTAVAAQNFLSTDNALAILVLAFVAVTMGAESKYADLHRAFFAVLRSWHMILLEVLGFTVVIGTIVGNLILHEEGQRANSAIVKGCVQDLQPVKTFGPACPQEMIPDPANQYLVLLRGLWPVLLHPDSLLVIHELLVALGASLLLARGACGRGSGLMALALTLLCLAHGARFAQWHVLGEYLPEGPLGWRFSVVCAGVASAALCIAMLRALWSARVSGAGMMRGLRGIVKFLLCLAALLTVSVWLASENHIDGGDWRDNVMFISFWTAGVCAAPLILVAVCNIAAEMPGLGGALLALGIAQVANLWWCGDFFGTLDDQFSMDPAVHVVIEMKQQLLEQVHGQPVVLMGGSQFAQTFCAIATCGAYAIIRLSLPEESPARQFAECVN